MLCFKLCMDSRVGARPGCGRILRCDVRRHAAQGLRAHQGVSRGVAQVRGGCALREEVVIDAESSIVSWANGHSMTRRRCTYSCRLWVLTRHHLWGSRLRFPVTAGENRHDMLFKHHLGENQHIRPRSSRFLASGPLHRSSFRRPHVSRIPTWGPKGPSDPNWRKRFSSNPPYANMSLKASASIPLHPPPTLLVTWNLAVAALFCTNIHKYIRDIQPVPRERTRWVGPSFPAKLGKTGMKVGT